MSRESTTAAAPGKDGTKWRVAAYLVCGVLLAIPFVTVTFPPITDLAWQAGEIRLFQEARLDPASPYDIRWFGPNRLAYALLGGAWGLGGPEGVTRISMIVLAIAWVAGLHWLAQRRGRPVAAAALACVFFFNHFVYNGYLNFAVGVPVFLVWMGAMLPAPPHGRPARWTLPGAFAGAAALFLAHVLWLAAGTLWFAINSVARRHPPRVVALRSLGIVPVLVVSALWYRMLPDDWSAQPTYQSALLSTTSAGALVNYALGGLRGWIEPAALLVVSLWATAAALQHRRHLPASLDRPLAGAGVLFIALALALPTSAGTTLDLASRWFPVGCILLVLSLPPVRARTPVSATLAVVVLGAYCAVTAIVWGDFEQREMRGFGECIEQIPAGATVLGLDHIRSSPRLKTWPFYLMHGYAAVLRDARPNISRVTHPASLVVHERTSDPWPWTAQLPWHPERVRASDFEHFDFVILHADEARRAALASEFGLAPVSADRDWRLYRVGEYR